MPTEREAGASVIVKNMSGVDYDVAELGGVVLGDGQSIDLMDDNLVTYYDSWAAANGLVAKANSSQLWADIAAGKIEVVESKPPNFLAGRIL